MEKIEPQGLPSTNPARRPTYDELWLEASGSDDAVIVEEAAVRRIECMKLHATYYSTKPTHAAHPSAVKRQLEKRDDGYHLHTQAYWYDEKIRPAFEQWMLAFRQQDEATKAKLSPS